MGKGRVELKCSLDFGEPENEGSAQGNGEMSERQFRTMLMVYTRLIEDLHEWQRRQWHVVYYAFLLIAGVAAMHTRILHYSPNLNSWVRWVAFGFCLCIGLIAAFAVSVLQYSARNTREHIKDYRENYRKEFEPLPYPECYDKWWRDSKALIMMWSALTLGSVATALFVLRLIE